MRVDFATFVDFDGQRVVVNPHQVRCVKSYDEGSIIYFDGDHTVLVTANLTAVLDGLTIEE
ncbi:MAG: hypothetical protein JO369_07675 [Paucibacter sp.]|nr:hypothetical protein [Roseateles sp.]